MCGHRTWSLTTDFHRSVTRGRRPTSNDYFIVLAIICLASLCEPTIVRGVQTWSPTTSCHHSVAWGRQPNSNDYFVIFAIICLASYCTNCAIGYIFFFVFKYGGRSFCNFAITALNVLLFFNVFVVFQLLSFTISLVFLLQFLLFFNYQSYIELILINTFKNSMTTALTKRININKIILKYQ